VHDALATSTRACLKQAGVLQKLCAVTGMTCLHHRFKSSGAASLGLQKWSAPIALMPVHNHAVQPEGGARAGGGHARRARAAAAGRGDRGGSMGGAVAGRKAAAGNALARALRAV